MEPDYMETAQRSKSQRPLNFFGSDRSDHMETSLKFQSFALFIILGKGTKPTEKKHLNFFNL